MLPKHFAQKLTEVLLNFCRWCYRRRRAGLGEAKGPVQAEVRERVQRGDDRRDRQEPRRRRNPARLACRCFFLFFIRFPSLNGTLYSGTLLDEKSITTVKSQ